MFVDVPAQPNGLLIVCDVRHKNDRDLQEKEGGSPVMRHWPFGKLCIGKSAWARTTRIALYDYGSKITTADKHTAQDSLMAYLLKQRPACTVVVQTRSVDQKSKEDFGDAKGLVGTHCWAALKAPDKLPDMAGCIWDAAWGPTVGVLNPVNYEYVFRELIRRHFCAALAVATSHMRPPVPGAMAWHDEPSAHVLLSQVLASAKAGVPIAVDIESFTDQSVITAIGFCDGKVAVSVPMESFAVFGTDNVEPAGSAFALSMVRSILMSDAPKLFHNYSYDIPLLRTKGYIVAGKIHDTMAMHVSVYKQWPHGLQKACAQELLTPPWKSEHKPQAAKQLKLSKKDLGWWTCDPPELRRYNCLDSFHTWRLGAALALKVGIQL